VRAAAPVQFRPVDLDPAPDTTGVDEQTTFESHPGHMLKMRSETLVPAHAPENDIARIVTPFERIRRGERHVSPYQILIRFSQRYLSANKGGSLEHYCRSIASLPRIPARKHGRLLNVAILPSRLMMFLVLASGTRNGR